jgi:chromosome segregation ATPase
MFKSEQDNKQLLWQLRTLQGADEKISKLLEQLHQLQTQNLEQNRELRETQNKLEYLLDERSHVFSELSKMGMTCEELIDVVK